MKILIDLSLMHAFDLKSRDIIVLGFIDWFNLNTENTFPKKPHDKITKHMAELLRSTSPAIKRSIVRLQNNKLI